MSVVSNDDIKKSVDALRSEVHAIRVIVVGDGGEARALRDRVRDLEMRGGLKGLAITAAGYVLAASIGLGITLLVRPLLPAPRQTTTVSP